MPRERREGVKKFLLLGRSCRVVQGVGRKPVKKGAAKQNRAGTEFTCGLERKLQECLGRRDGTGGAANSDNERTKLLGFGEEFIDRLASRRLFRRRSRGPY